MSNPSVVTLKQCAFPAGYGKVETSFVF